MPEPFREPVRETVREPVREPVREQGRYYEELFNNLPGFAYRSKVLPERDPDGGYRFQLEVASQGCHPLLGLSPAEMVGHGLNTLERMAHPEDFARLRAEVGQSLDAGRPYSVQYRLVTPAGAIRWVWEQGRGIYNAEGTLCFLEGMVMDISEQKRRELALQEENRSLRDGREFIGMGTLVGQSPAMQRLYGKIRMAAASDANVIIYGETGTGKDMVAQLIHTLGRRKGAYVPVNCGAISEHLMESEFFGHVKGAFSGAHMNKDGFIAAAHEGTLFLDEIGELPLPLQVTLLRTLENKTYTPVGGHAPKTSSFRLIAATNRDLAAMVRAGAVRSDFYHRIHVLSLTMPPLRERMDDLGLLIDDWMERRGLVRTLPPDLRAAMDRYDWPGNVREVHNFLERYQAFGESSLDTHEAWPDMQRMWQEFCDHGPETGQPAPAAPPAAAPVTPAADAPLAGERVRITLDDLSLKDAARKAEEAVIRQALAECRWRQERAAGLLGVSLRTLQRKMRELGIER